MEKLFHRKKNKFDNHKHNKNKYSSKVLHTWEFDLKNIHHKVEFWDSKMSGKKKVAVDDEVIVESNPNCAIFNYSFKLDSYYINLIQLTDDKYDLKINNNLYSDIMEYELSGRLKKDKEEKEKHRDLPNEKNIDINFKYDENEQYKRNIKHLNKIEKKRKKIMDDAQ